MNHRIVLRICIATFVLSVVLVLSSTLLARASGMPDPLGALYDLSFWSVDGGGGSSAGGTYTVLGDVGQPDAGRLSGGAYTLDGGFLAGALAPRPVLVPIIRR